MKYAFEKNITGETDFKYRYEYTSGLNEYNYKDEMKRNLKIQNSLKELFYSVKFHKIYHHHFKFLDPSDEAYFLIWSADRECEI